MKFFNWFYRENFFIIFTLVWWWVALIYLILKPIEKINTGSGVKMSDLQSKQ